MLPKKFCLKSYTPTCSTAWKPVQTFKRPLGSSSGMTDKRHCYGNELTINTPAYSLFCTFFSYCIFGTALSLLEWLEAFFQNLKALSKFSKLEMKRFLLQEVRVQNMVRGMSQNYAHVHRSATQLITFCSLIKKNIILVGIEMILYTHKIQNHLFWIWTEVIHLSLKAGFGKRFTTIFWIFFFLIFYLVI